MRMLGAKVILTPAAERGSGMVRKAEELAKKHGWFLARQFENQANPAYHRQTTGPEILSDFAGRRLDFFVTGWGTGGTLTGAGEMIRLARPEVRIVVTEPAGASLLAGAEFKPHKIQGWTPDFVPKVLNRSVPHEILPVTDDEAIPAARALAGKRGNLLRHLLGRHVRRGAQGGGEGAEGLGDPGDAAGHRRALPDDGAVRGHPRRGRSGTLNRHAVHRSNARPSDRQPGGAGRVTIRCDTGWTAGSSRAYRAQGAYVRSRKRC